MDDPGFVDVTADAGRAFGAFDWSAHAGKAVRLFVQGMSCSGPSIGMALDDPGEADEIVERHGVRFVIDGPTGELLRQGGGLKVDYIDENERRGYLLTLGKPGDCHSGGGCGCG